MTSENYVTREELQTESRIIRLEEIAVNIEKSRKSDERRQWQHLAIIVSALIAIFLMVMNINSEIGEIKTDVAFLKSDVAGLKTDVAGLKTDVAGLKTDVAELRAGQEVLKTDVAALQTGQEHILTALRKEGIVK